MTQNKETYRFKGRAIFLAAIMVISVLAMPIAFAGGAAANASSLDNGAADDVPVNSDEAQQNVTFDVTVDEGTLDSITVDLEAAADAGVAPALDDISSDNEDVEVSSAELDGTDVTFDVEDVAEPASGDQNAEITVELTHDTTALDNSLAGASVDFPIEAGSGESTTATFELLENVNPQYFNEAGDERSLFYQGQEVTATGLEVDTEYQLRSVDSFDGSGPGASVEGSSFVDEYETNDTGVLVIDDELDNGDYVLRGPGVEENRGNSFEVTEQRLTAEFEDDEVSDTGDNALLDIEFDSNRNAYDLNVSADGDLDTDDLEQIFTENSGLSLTAEYDANTEDFEDDDTVQIRVTGDDDYELNFTDIDADDYDFDFEVDDTTASASDSITVVEGDDGELDIDDVTVTQGDIAEFTVEFDNTEEGVVFIGEEEDDGYQANVSIDSDGEDEVTFYFNTYAAGLTSSDNLDGAITEENIIVADEDSDATVELVNLDAGAQDLSAILDSGDYEVGAYAASLPHDDETFVDAVDDPDTITTLTINDRTDLDANLWRTSENVVDDLLDELDDGDSDAMEFIGEGVENDLVTETDMFAVTDGDGNGASDFQVHQISADGLHGILGLAGDEPEQFDDLDTTESFEAALTVQNEKFGASVDNDQSLVFELEEQNPGSNQDPIELNLSAVAEEEDLDEFTNVVYDGNAGDYYVVINTDALIDYVDEDPSGIGFEDSIEEDQEYDVTFAVQDARLLDETDDQDDLEDLYEEINWEFDLDEAEGDFQNMNENDEVEVENSDESDVSVDTNVAPGTELDIRLRNAQGTSPSFIKNDRDLVVSADGVVTGTFDMSEQSVDDELTASVRQASFELEEDGIVVDAVEEVDDDEMDDHDDDADDGMDDHDDMDDDAAADDDEAVDDETEDDTPGFGALIALVAVLGAALLAVRRQN